MFLATRVALCVWALCGWALPGSAWGQTTSVWTAAGAMDNWTDPENWENNPPLEAFPDNNNGGDFIVAIPSGRPMLDQDITVSDLILGVDTAGGGLISGGNELIAQGGAVIGTLGGFDGGDGTFTAAGGIEVGGAFLINNWSVTANEQVTLGVSSANGSITLQGNAQLFLNQGLQFLKNGFFSSPVGSDALVTNLGEFTRAAGATGVSDVNVNFVDNGGTIGTTSGTLSFAPGRTARLTNTTLHINANGSIRFGGDTTINGAATVMGNGVGNVKFDGNTAVVTLNGTLENLFNATDSPSIEFGGNQFSGGTLDLQAGPGFIHSGGNLGVDGAVTNRGRYNWTNGAITGMGLVNENNVAGQTVFSTTADKIITGSAFNNMGHATQTGNIRLDADGKVINSLGGTYLLQNAIVNSGLDANTETGFFNQGTLESSGNSQFSARLNSSNEIRVHSGSLKLGGPTNLTGTTQSPAVVNLSAGANLQIGISSSSVSNLSNVRFEPTSGVGPPSETKINFVGGASSLIGLIQSQGIGEIVHESGTLRVRSSDSATFEFADSAPFVLKSDPNGASFQVAGSLTNDGAIRWESGALTGQGTLLNAENAGQITVTGAAHLGNDSSFAMIQNDGVINVTSPAGQGLILPTGSKLVNRKEGLFDFIGDGGVLGAGETDRGSFENSGIVGKIAGNSSRVTTPFMQTDDGIIEVQSGRLKFEDVVSLRGRIEIQRGQGVVGIPIVDIVGNSVTENLNLLFDPGNVLYDNSLSIFRGTIAGEGSDGALRLSSKEHRIDGDVTFDVKGERVQVSQESGVLGGDGRVVNKGTYRLIAGSIANTGSASSGGDPTVKPFTNQGRFDWSGGNIQTSFDNRPAPAGFVASGLNILRGFDKHLVGSTLFNASHISHLDDFVTVDENSSIVNQADGSYGLHGGGGINPPTNGGNPGVFVNRGLLQGLGSQPLETANIAIPFTNDQGTIGVSDFSPLNITGGYTLRSGNQGGAILLADNTELNFGPVGTVDGTSFNLAGGSTVSFSAPTLTGNLTGTGPGKADFINALIERNTSLLLSLQNAFFTGNATLFGSASNVQNLTIDPGLASVVNFVQADVNGNPLGPGGILRNAEGASLALLGVDISHSLATPLAESQWGQIQNEGAMAISTSEHSLNLTLNEVLIRNFEQGVIGASVGIIGGNGRIENQGTFLGRGVTIETPFDNSGTFIAELGNNEIRDLAQFQDGILTGGAYRVTPAARLLIGSGTLRQNLADITLDGATAQFEGIESLSTNDGALNFQGGYSYENNAEAFRNTGSLRFDNAFAVFSGVAMASGNFTVLNSELLVDRLVLLSEITAQFDDSTIIADEVSNGGVLDIGSSPGYALIDGDYTQTGTLEMEIGGLEPGVEYDLLEITGTAQLGGTLNVTGLDLGGYTPAAGDSFALLAATNSIQSEFDLVQYPVAVGGWLVTWDPVNYSDPNQVVLEINSVGFRQADFDQDSAVDQSDLSTWQNGFGTLATATHGDGDASGDADVDGDDFLIWQRQFEIEPPLNTLASVPEPTCALLTLAALLLTVSRRRFHSTSPLVLV